MKMTGPNPRPTEAGALGTGSSNLCTDPPRDPTGYSLRSTMVKKVWIGEFPVTPARWLCWSGQSGDRGQLGGQRTGLTLLLRRCGGG